MELKEEAEYWEIWEVVVIDKDTQRIARFHILRRTYTSGWGSSVSGFILES